MCSELAIPVCYISHKLYSWKPLINLAHDILCDSNLAGHEKGIFVAKIDE